MHLNAPLTIAGAETTILTFLEHAEKELFDLSVTSFINPIRCPDNPFPAAVEVRGGRFQLLPICRSIDVRDVGKVIRVLRKNRVQILHTHGYRADIIGLIAARYCGVRLVSTVHGWTPVSGKLRLYEALDLWALKHFDNVIAVARPLAETLVRSWGTDDKVTLLLNAVSFKGTVATSDESMQIRAAMRRECDLCPNDYVAGVIGRLSSEKGVNYFLESFPLLSVRFPQLKAIVVGNGTERHVLEAQAKKLGVLGNVKFLGYREDISDIFRALDVLVLPSLTEGVPIVVLEAFVHRVPVIASGVGGLPEIIDHGINGLLVPPGEPERIAQALEMLLTDIPHGERLAQTAYDRAMKQFDPQQWARRIEAVYSQVILRR